MNEKPFLVAVLIVLAFIFQASAGGSRDHSHDQGTNIGRSGKTTEVNQTVLVTMYDNYYKPKLLSFKEGETVRFVIKNDGSFVHEFSIATTIMHKAHEPEMLMLVEHGVLEPDKINWDIAKAMQISMGHGMHNEPNSVLLEPGKTGEIIWTFSKNIDLEFACNIPGHYESGMVGTIHLTH